MTYVVAEKFRTANVEECFFGFLFKLLWPSKCIRHILDSSVNYFICTELVENMFDSWIKFR